MGANNCRRYFLTAEQFDAAQAREMGLLQEVVEDSEGLAAMEQRFKDAIRLTSPAAVRWVLHSTHKRGRAGGETLVSLTVIWFALSLGLCRRLRQALR